MLKVNFWKKVGQVNRAEFLIANLLVSVSYSSYYSYGKFTKYFCTLSCQDVTETFDIKMSKVKMLLYTMYSQCPQGLFYVRNHGADYEILFAGQHKVYVLSVTEYSMQQYIILMHREGITLIIFKQKTNLRSNINICEGLCLINLLNMHKIPKNVRMRTL